MAVEEAERKTDELGVEGAAQVHLDPEGLVARDQAAPDRRQRLRDADRNHDPDQEHDRVAVVALDCRDDGARQPDEAERPRLRGEREQHRDDEGDLVRPEKPEETNESPAVAGRRGHALRLRAGPNSTELCVHERDGEFDLGAVRGRVEPAARAGGMGERDRDNIAGQLVPVANALADGRYSQQATRRQAADRDDERRADDRELPFAPEGAEVLLLRRRSAVAAARRLRARVAAGDRGAVEGLVELLLLEPEP